jgi:hypothetical protein
LVAAGVVVLATAALGVTPSAGQSPASSTPPLPSTLPTPLDPDAVVLVGTIMGSNSGPGRPVDTNYSATTTMDVVLNLAPDRATASGLAEISGEYTGDCEFSDSGNVPIAWDSNPPVPEPDTPTEGRPAFAIVQVFTQDPRYADRPLTGIYLSVAAGLGGSGGTCGHHTGRIYDITDVDFPLRIDLQGCNFFEVLNANNGSWSGSCEQTDSSGMQTFTWSAEFAEAYSPSE